MATVVDELVITLGLDPTKFTAGQRRALEEFKKTQEEASKRASRFEEAARRSQLVFSRIRNEAVGLFGVLAGAYGIKQFIGNMVQSDAAVGRFSRITGIAVRDVSAFDKAVELAGGRVGAGAEALGNLNSQMEQFNLGTEQGAQFMASLRALMGQGQFQIPTGPNVTRVQQMLAIGENLRRVAERFGAGRALQLGRLLGLNDDTINLLIQGRERIRELFDEAVKLGAATDANAKAAEQFWNAWAKLSTVIQNQARPAIEGLYNFMKEKGLDTEGGLMSFLFGKPEEQNALTKKFLGALGLGPGLAPGESALPPWMSSFVNFLRSDFTPATLFGGPAARNRTGTVPWETPPPALPPTGAGAGGSITGGLGYNIIGFEPSAGTAASSFVHNRSIDASININSVTVSGMNSTEAADNLREALSKLATARRNAALANSN